jgi:hypothetical protein
MDPGDAGTVVMAAQPLAGLSGRDSPQIKKKWPGIPGHFHVNQG